MHLGNNAEFDWMIYSFGRILCLNGNSYFDYELHVFFFKSGMLNCVSQNIFSIHSFAVPNWCQSCLFLNR